MSITATKRVKLQQTKLTVSQIVQLCTHVLGVERNFNMLSVKMAKLSSVDRARDRARVIGHLEAGWKQRDVAALLGVSQSTLSKLRLRYRDTHDVKDMPTSGRPHITTDRVESGSFNSPSEFEESSHHCTQPTDALFRTSWQVGVCTDHQEPATCFPVEIPESCPCRSPS